MPGRTDAYRGKQRSSWPPLLWLPIAFFLFLIIGALRHELPREFPIAYLTSSVVTAVIYRRDKAKAERGEWRTPEATLHLLDLLCGWPGGLVAQQVWRHQTRKLSFQFIFWLGTVMHLVFWGWVFVNLPAESDLGAFIERVLRVLKHRSA